MENEASKFLDEATRHWSQAVTFKTKTARIMVEWAAKQVAANDVIRAERESTAYFRGLEFGKRALATIATTYPNPEAASTACAVPSEKEGAEHVGADKVSGRGDSTIDPSQGNTGTSVTGSALVPGSAQELLTALRHWEDGYKAASARLVKLERERDSEHERAERAIEVSVREKLNLTDSERSRKELGLALGRLLSAASAYPYQQEGRNWLQELSEARAALSATEDK
jgi:hypothetical protein